MSRSDLSSSSSSGNIRRSAAPSGLPRAVVAFIAVAVGAILASTALIAYFLLSKR